MSRSGERGRGSLSSSSPRLCVPNFLLNSGLFLMVSTAPLAAFFTASILLADARGGGIRFTGVAARSADLSLYLICVLHMHYNWTCIMYYSPSPSRSPNSTHNAAMSAVSVGRIHPLSSNPNKMWEILSSKQTVYKVHPHAPQTPKPPNHTRFVCISGSSTLINFTS